jgi:membrane protein
MDQTAVGPDKNEPRPPPRVETSQQRPNLGRRVVAAIYSARSFARQVFKKAEADNIFFMAGAISFNVIVAIVPLLLAALGIAGTVLRIRSTDPTEPLIRYITESLPAIGDVYLDRIRDILHELIDQSAGLLGIGTIFLIWFATRLVGTLRTALREVFDIPEGRSIVAGKIFDAKMVVAAGTLLAVNVGLTITLDVVVAAGIRVLGLTPGQIKAFQILYGQAIAFLIIWLMFLLIYRYLPARKAQWRTALEAATFTAILFELMKQLFGWYVTTLANYGSMYGSLSTLFILFFWIYHTAVIFIQGGEIAHVSATPRIRRRQLERLQ